VEAFGLASGVVQYVPDPKLDHLVPESLRIRVESAADSLKAGTLIAAPRPKQMEAYLPFRTGRAPLFGG
jgi:hypothetical protein